MIGRITLKNGIVIELTDDGPMVSNDEQLQRIANYELKSYARFYSPAQGSFGVDLLHKLAKELGGKVEIEKKPPAPPGRIY